MPEGPSLSLPGTPTTGGPARLAFVRARLGSVLAVAPLGAWTAVHLWHNLAAFEGAEAWQSAVTEYPHPFAEALVGVVVLLPLAIHTVWGLARLATSRPNNIRYRFYGNLKYLLQRLSALGLLLFLGAHLWLALLEPRLREGHAEVFADLAQQMHFHRPTLVVYILGTLAASYHLADGLLTFCMSWGVVSSQRALRRLERSALVIFVLLLAMSWGAIYAFWAAGAPAQAAARTVGADQSISTPVASSSILARPVLVPDDPACSSQSSSLRPPLTTVA